jgi:hypothetical protein
LAHVRSSPDIPFRLKNPNSLPPDLNCGNTTPLDAGDLINVFLVEFL